MRPKSDHSATGSAAAADSLSSMDPLLHLLSVLPFSFLRPPKTRLKLPSSLPLPSATTVLSLLLLTYFAVVSGLVYDVIVEPPRHRQHPGPPHRRSPPRRLPPRASQRTVHYRGPLLWLHVPRRRRRDHTARPRAGSQPGEVRQGLVRGVRDLVCGDIVRDGHALHPDQDPILPMVNLSLKIVSLDEF
ncbi:putative oligosaccharyltransferase complex subunit [Iris pallida]|uniref:Oligosaccharyltransferase complex subunit n=1 Tax=Iris pallida TaxID=29817 RepID=A0AAX6HDL7_IRIPA|nr:putative oligosaccharyltransferase complex subunit [Iris pallida]